MRLVKRLERYESKYFNCYHSLLVSYLHHLQYPVEFLFYRSLESSRRVYQHFILHGKQKWNFPFTILSKEDLLILDVRLYRRVRGVFDEAEPEIRALLREQCPVFLSLDMFHLAHKTDQYKQSPTPHTVMLIEFVQTPGKDGYRLLDDDHRHSGDYRDYFYRRPVIKKGFDSFASEHAYSYLRFSRRDPDKVPDETSRAFARWLSLYEDDLQFYACLEEYLANFSLRDVERWCNSLSFMTASRKMFARYLHVANGPDPIREQAAISANFHEIIKNQLRRKAALSQTDTDSLIERCRKLKKIEKEMVDKLVAHYL